MADVFDFDYHNEVHRLTANKILNICGTTDHAKRPIYECKRFQQFFALPNFIEIAGLENLSSLQAMAAISASTRATYEEDWPVSPREQGFFEGWMQVVLILLNVTISVCFILNDQFREIKNIRNGFWRLVSVPFTAVFLVEAIMIVLTVDGSTLIREKKLYLLELILQGVSILAYIKLYTDGSEEQYAFGAALL